MTLTSFPSGANRPLPAAPFAKVTMPALSKMKRQGRLISALTAYDYSSARLVDEAGIDLVLVGDSLAMVVLGHENTMAITVDASICRAFFILRMKTRIFSFSARLRTCSWKRSAAPKKSSPSTWMMDICG